MKTKNVVRLSASAISGFISLISYCGGYHTTAIVFLAITLVILIGLDAIELLAGLAG